jgi:hypothetical protein
MTICPIAIAAGCRKCPAFRVCPLKTVLGDVPKPSGDGRTVAADPPKRDERPKKAR